MSDPADSNVKSARRSLLTRFASFWSAWAFLAALATTLAMIGSRWWLLDLFSHFRVQYTVLLAVEAILLIVLRRFRWAALALVFTAINASTIIPLYFSSSMRPATGRTYKLVLLNVHSSNRDVNRVLDLLRQEQPDFIVLLEVNQRWIGELRVLSDEYPHFLVRPREDNFGVAFYSRIAPDDARIEDIGGARVPSTVARFSVEGKPLTIIGTHALPPMNAVYFAERNSQLAAAFARGDELAANGNAVILAGDFNSTAYWSRVFASSVGDTKLRDSREGFGVQSSWPTFIPVARIPLDHCFVSESIVVHSRRIGPGVGSDHLPVIVEFTFAPAE